MDNKLTQQQFNEAIKQLKASARKADKDGFLRLTYEEGLALYKYLAPKYDTRRNQSH